MSGGRVGGDFFQDFAASEVDATLFGLVGTAVAVAVRPLNTTIAATNPEYQGSGILTSYPPMSGAVGEELTTTARFVPASGDLVRDVTP